MAGFLNIKIQDGCRPYSEVGTAVKPLLITICSKMDWYMHWYIICCLKSPHKISVNFTKPNKTLILQVNFTGQEWRPSVLLQAEERMFTVSLS